MASSEYSNISQKPGMKRARSSDPPRAFKRSNSQPSQHQVTLLATGQTAPRLISTLKTTDRRQRGLHERNPFTDPPCGFDERFDANIRQTLTTPCKHYWTTQTPQSVLPESDIGLSGGRYRLACICQYCRWHVDITIEHSPSPCPKDEFPLHHLTRFTQDQEDQEWYQAQCSGCAANIRIDYRAARMRDSDIILLTDPDLLQQRLETAKQKDPERAQLDKAAQAIDVLDALATYITDALKPTDTPKKIPKLNRRFVTSFGDDCAELLKTVGFEELDGIHLQLPRPEPSNPWTWDLRKQLEDIQEELFALIRDNVRRNPGLETSRLKCYREKPGSFDDDIQLLLSTFEYDKTRTTRRTPILTLEESSWYAGLGALGDFSDDLLSFSFDRQVACDALNLPYYYDCLAKIAKKRNSETLEVKTALLASEGYYGRDELANAYKYFTLDPRQAAEFTDEHIRGVFESRIGSMASSQELEARQKLRMIGVSRNSKVLQDAASNDLTSWESALRWLEPQYDGSVEYPDDYIISIATVKKADKGDQATEDNIIKAVKLIADHRNSDALHAWLTTGEARTSAPEDELAAAYRFFNLQDRSADIDPEVLELNYTLIRDEDPSKEPDAKRFMGLLLNQKRTVTPVRADYTKPVGLENIGNTCYLNSLLQYYNAVKPFRDTVLGFDEYKQKLDTDKDAVFGKVGGELITRRKVRDGQEFMSKLAELFATMRSAPGPAVKPDEVLAYQALQLPSNRRNTIVDPVLPKLDQVSGLKTTGEEMKDINTSESNQTVKGDDEASDVTLIGDVVMTPESEGEEKQLVITDHDIVHDANVDDCKKGGMAENSTNYSTPPMHDPPPPPNDNKGTGDIKNERKNSTAQAIKQQAESWAQQQDASEVALNIVQKTLSAIEPYSIGEDGERADRIRDIFYGEYRSVYPKKELEDTQSHDPNLIISVHKKPKDIREGLDQVFQRETIDLDEKGTATAKRYSVIRKLPPVLQVYLQNQWFDRKTEKAGKIMHYVTLNETIYLDPYMESASTELQNLRTLSWDMQDRLAELVKDKAERYVDEDLSSEQAFDTLSNLIGGIEGGATQEVEDLRFKLEAAAETDRKKSKELDAEITRLQTSLNALPFDQHYTQKNCYRIFAIFIHRGSNKFGHWWIYIRDFKNNIWREFNDGRVTELADDTEIFKEKNPVTEGTAPFVVYVRDEEKDQLVDSLYREAPEGAMDIDDTQLAPVPDSNAYVEVREVEMTPLGS